MAILASAIIASSRGTLRDPSPGVFWDDLTLLGYLNESQRHACLLRPDLYTVRAAIAMVAGTLQTIPAGGTVFMRLDENVVGKQRCRLVDSAMLDAALRTWPAATATVAVEEYCADAEDKKRFHVLPPNTGTGSVIGHYAMTPPVIAAVGNAIGLDDVCELLLKHFLLSEAYAADTPRKDMAKAQFYRQGFERALGLNERATGALLPKYGATPGGA